jgi:hypothetical protein
VGADGREEASCEAADQPLAALDVGLSKAARDHAAHVRVVTHQEGPSTLLGRRDGRRHTAGGRSVDEDVDLCRG